MSINQDIAEKVASLPLEERHRVVHELYMKYKDSAEYLADTQAQRELHQRQVKNRIARRQKADQYR